MIRNEVIEELISEGDLFTPIWNELNNIWEMPKLTKKINVEELYEDKEELTSKFEQSIFNVFFEIYDILVERVNQESTIKRILKEDEYTIIIMDGLSIREANFFFRSLNSEKFKINDYLFLFSSLPSNTGSFCKRFFGFSQPSQMINKKSLPFKFIQVVEDEDIERIRGNEKRLVVWCVLPDSLLHIKERGRLKVITISNALEKTKEALLKILNRVNSDEVIVTSDHGYIYHRPVTSWILEKDYETLMRRIFVMDRAKEKEKIDNKIIKRLRDISPEESFIHIDKDHIFVKGRFVWSVPGKPFPIRHGGISLMENLIPLIQFKKVR